MTRTQDEIVARIQSLKSLFEFGSEVLVQQLDYAHAERFLKPGVTEADWAGEPDPEEALRYEANGYLDFAIGKIIDHRGISAVRSVEKLTEYAWLLGDDATMAEMTRMYADDQYAQYGAPIVKYFAEHSNMTSTWEAKKTPGLDRMAVGLPCTDNCEEGCAR